MRVQLDNFI